MRDGQWKLYFGLPCIWWLRNDLAFNGNRTPKTNLVLEIHGQENEFLMSISAMNSTGFRSVVAANISAKWLTLDFSWIKLNSDGPSQDEGHNVAVGGVLRGWKGHWLIGFCHRMDSKSSSFC